MNRLMCRIAVLGATLIATGAALAQPYPNKPIRIILGFAPGSVQEAVGRLVTNEMMKTMNQSIVFDIMPVCLET